MGLPTILAASQCKEIDSAKALKTGLLLAFGVAGVMLGIWLADPLIKAIMFWILEL